MFGGNGGVGRLIVDDDRRFVKVVDNHIVLATGQLNIAVVDQRQVVHGPAVQFEVHRSCLGGEKAAYRATRYRIVGGKWRGIVGQHLAIQLHHVHVVPSYTRGGTHLVYLELCCGG